MRDSIFQRLVRHASIHIQSPPLELTALEATPSVDHLEERIVRMVMTRLPTPWVDKAIVKNVLAVVVGMDGGWGKAGGKLLEEEERAFNVGLSKMELVNYHRRSTEAGEPLIC